MSGPGLITADDLEDLLAERLSALAVEQRSSFVCATLDRLSRSQGSLGSTDSDEKRQAIGSIDHRITLMMHTYLVQVVMAASWSEALGPTARILDEALVLEFSRKFGRTVLADRVKELVAAWTGLSNKPIVLMDGETHSALPGREFLDGVAADALLFSSLLQSPTLALILAKETPGVATFDITTYGQDGRAFEARTLIGQLLRPSCLDLKVVEKFFPMDQAMAPLSHLRQLGSALLHYGDPDPQSAGQFTFRVSTAAVEQCHSEVRLLSSGQQENMAKAFLVLLGHQHPSNLASCLLTFSAQACAANWDRTKMSGGMATPLASNGFFANLVAVWCRVARSFLSSPPSAKQFKSVNPRIFFSKHRIDFHRLGSDGFLSGTLEGFAEVAREEEKRVEQETRVGLPAFSLESEIVLAVTTAIHVGIIPLIREYSEAVRTHQRLRTVEESGSGRAQVVRGQCLRHLLMMDAFLLDPDFVAPLFEMMHFLGSWMVYQTELPQPEVGLLPDWLLEDIHSIWEFYVTFHPAVLSPFFLQVRDLVRFLVRFGGARRLEVNESPDVVRFWVANPHLRAQCLNLMCVGFRPRKGSHESVLRLADDVWAYSSSEKSESALDPDDIIRALAQLYVDIEHTGRSEQFYEKFSFREQVAAQLKFLRSRPAYAAAIQRFVDCVAIESSAERVLFKKWMNFVLNDGQYLLDELLEKLPLVREAESVQATAAAASSEDEETDLQHNIRDCEIFGRLSNRTLDLLHFLSASHSGTVLSVVGAERVATMLNYFLYHIAGPQSVKLKVQGMQERFKFRPRVLLTQAAGIYLALDHAASAGDSRPFAEVVASESTFNGAAFSAATTILRKHGLLSQKALLQFETFVETVLAAAEKIAEEADDEDDAPEEFLDPITSAIMTDPCKLPLSGQIVDRTTIERHLLNDPTDPFTRQPLEASDLVEEKELKTRIDEWRSSKKRLA